MWNTQIGREVAIDMEVTKAAAIVGLIMWIGGLIAFFAVAMSPSPTWGWAQSGMIAALISAIGFILFIGAAIYHFVFKRK